MLQLMPAPPPLPEYCLLWADRWLPISDPWWLCMQKAEWSGWAQALGAVLAIFFAVRIAGTQERQRRAEAITEAGVTAALVTSILIEIRSAVFDVQTADRHFDRRHFQDAILAFVAATSRFVALPLPSEDQLVRLSASPHTKATELAGLCSQINIVKRAMAMIDWARDAEIHRTPGLSVRAGTIEHLGQIETLLVASQKALEDFRTALGLSTELRSAPNYGWGGLWHRLTLRFGRARALLRG